MPHSKRVLTVSFQILNNLLELVFLDGGKQLQETLALFARLMPYLNPQCLVIFDEIHWSA
jgi:predicted O-methyltransferase YrrM